MTRVALLLALAAGCKDYEALCEAADPSVTPEDCWYAGYDEGYTEAQEAAYDRDYDSGYAACEADLAATR